MDLKLEPIMVNSERISFYVHDEDINKIVAKIEVLLKNSRSNMNEVSLYVDESYRNKKYGRESIKLLKRLFIKNEALLEMINNSLYSIVNTSNLASLKCHDSIIEEFKSIDTMIIEEQLNKVYRLI